MIYGTCPAPAQIDRGASRRLAGAPRAAFTGGPAQPVSQVPSVASISAICATGTCSSLEWASIGSPGP